MIFKLLVSSALLILYATNVLAAASYDSEKNVVILQSPMIGTTLTGRLTIYNKKHIEITGTGLTKKTKKLIQLCGKNKDLGLIYLNGEVDFDAKVPKITNVDKFNFADDKEAADAGWVFGYVLTGNDAEDLLDLLYTNRSVGFGISSSKCTPTKFYAGESITLNFETKGLERAMNRIK